MELTRTEDRSHFFFFVIGERSGEIKIKNNVSEPLVSLERSGLQGLVSCSDATTVVPLAIVISI